MSNSKYHTFHIPVMGLGYTIDTPVKVARFGISSVVSIIEDNLVEEMRKYYCRKENEEYIPITKDDDDHRAKRITAYLNLLNKIVKKQIEKLKAEPFEKGNDIVKYFELLPDNSSLKKIFEKMNGMENKKEKEFLQKQLKNEISVGAIDVNIMTKCDRNNYSKDRTLLASEYSDALAALRGFAMSQLSSSVVFSAGMNPRLYSYCGSFKDFFPDENSHLSKKIILKVSDYRSALIQGKFLAKKGLWISEFRIESGLNCGGHVFPTEGLLMGPILEEFKLKRTELADELFNICNAVLLAKGQKGFSQHPALKITAQGGIGTANENNFLLDYYSLDSTGWGSPFLLVPEVTNVDDETLKQLVSAKKEDYYLSNASPLGISFRNFHKSSAEEQRKNRIEKGKPGSPCYKKFLSFNSELSSEPICTASREYQDLKIKQLKEKNIPEKLFKQEFDAITEKDCLCEGLGAAVLCKNNIVPNHNLNAVSICPGPNLAYFSNTFSLSEMVGHIYGRVNLMNLLPRPHLFINELNLYIDYLKKEIEKSSAELSIRQAKYLKTIKENLLLGIEYYKSLIAFMKLETDNFLEVIKNELLAIELVIKNIVIPEAVPVTCQSSQSC
ncbi:MAG: hypothetical protein V1781_09125 [Bacteroidota bacterium]